MTKIADEAKSGVRLLRLFYAALAGVLTLILINTVVFNPYYTMLYGSNVWRILSGTLISVLMLWGIDLAIRRHLSTLEAKYSRILACFCGLMTVILILFGYYLEFKPINDIEAVFEGAKDWAVSGSFARNSIYKSYFSRYPHNIGMTAFLTVLFKICQALEIQNLFMAATVLNAVLCIGMMMCAIDILRRFSGVRGALLGLTLLSMNLPFAFCAASIYTDAYSLVFPPMILWSYLKMRDAASWPLVFRYALLTAAVAFVGSLIKATVVIMLIAVLIELLVKRKWKPLVILSIGATIIFSGGYAAWNQMIYNHHIPKTELQREKFPVMFWLMMGQNDESWGLYNYADTHNAQLQPGYEERLRMTRETFVSRAKEHFYTPQRLIDWLKIKASITFGDGTFGISGALNEQIRRTFLCEVVHPSGAFFSVFYIYSTGVYCVMLLSVIRLSLRSAMLRDGVGLHDPTVCIALFGIIIFLLFWEAGSRYFFNYLPVLLIASAMGITLPYANCVSAD